MLLVSLQLHSRLQVTVVIFMFVLGVWGIVNYVRKRTISPDYMGALMIGELLIIVEALFGVFVFLYGLRPARTYMHILYGITAVISLPGAFAYTKGRDDRWENMVYGCVCLFLAGLSLRLQQIATSV